MIAPPLALPPPEPAALAPADAGARRVVYAGAAVLAGALAYFLWQIPVQVSDSVANIGKALATPWGTLFRDELTSTAYFRPLLHLQTKLVLALSAGREFEAFRVIQIVQVLAAFWLFVRALRVRTSADAVGALVALTVFCGSHTFAGLLNEAYPINNWLTVALCVLVALNVATEERPRPWTDALVIGSLVLAAGTIETGLLVWVTIVAAAAAGYRGISRRALVACTAIVAAYALARVVVLDVGTPGLDERSSGFLFARLDERQLAATFGGAPLLFYAYNVISSAATVLFSEPRGGVIMIGQALLAGDLRPWMVVNLASATAATLAVVWYGGSSRWRRPTAAWTPGQRILFIAAAVLCANAVVSYPYTKDQIMSVAGVVMAAAVAAPVAMLVSSPRVGRTPAVRALAAVLLAVTAAGWSLRVVGRQHALAHVAFVTRNDWGMGDPLQEVDARDDPRVAALIGALRSRALEEPPAYPHVFSTAAAEVWFDHTVR